MNRLFFKNIFQRISNIFHRNEVFTAYNVSFPKHMMYEYNTQAKVMRSEMANYLNSLILTNLYMIRQDNYSVQNYVRKQLKFVKCH